jgi:hypothetical protein
VADVDICTDVARLRRSYDFVEGGTHGEPGKP